MSLQVRLTDLISQIGADIKSLSGRIFSIESLPTVSVFDGGATPSEAASGAAYVQGSNPPIDIQIFTVSGTWTMPDRGQTQCRIEMYGSGGGGGAGAVGLTDLTDTGTGAPGSGGGAYAEDTLPLCILVPQSL